MFPLCSSSLSRTQQLAAQGGAVAHPHASPHTDSLSSFLSHSLWGRRSLCHPTTQRCLPAPLRPSSMSHEPRMQRSASSRPSLRSEPTPVPFANFCFFPTKTKTTQKRPRSEQQQTPKTWGLRERHRRQSPPWPRAPLLLIPTVWGRTADAPLRDAAGDGAHRGYRDIYIYN